MSKHVTRALCWLRDHRLEREIVQVNGHVGYIDSCRCGKRAMFSGRRLQYPLARGRARSRA